MNHYQESASCGDWGFNCCVLVQLLTRYLILRTRVSNFRKLHSVNNVSTKSCEFEMTVAEMHSLRFFFKKSLPRHEAIKSMKLQALQSHNCRFLLTSQKSIFIVKCWTFNEHSRTVSSDIQSIIINSLLLTRQAKSWKVKMSISIKFSIEDFRLLDRQGVQEGRLASMRHRMLQVSKSAMYMRSRLKRYNVKINTF